VRIKDGVGTLVHGNVLNGIVEVAKVGLVELRSKTIRQRTHALQKEGDTEKVDMVLVNPDVRGGLVQKGIYITSQHDSHNMI